MGTGLSHPGGDGGAFSGVLLGVWVVSCETCCHCVHEPPEGVTPAQVEVATGLAAIMGTKPIYSRNGRYRPLVKAHGDHRTMSLPRGGHLRVTVWGDDHVQVSVEANCVPAEDADAMLRALFPPAKHKRASKRSRRRP